MRTGVQDALFLVSFLFTIIMLIEIFAQNFWGAVVAGVIQCVIPLGILFWGVKKV